MNKLPRIFVAISLAVCLALPNPATAHPELSRRVLRPQADRAGLESKLSVRPEPFDSAAHPEFVEGERPAQDRPVEGQSSRAGPSADSLRTGLEEVTERPPEGAYRVWLFWWQPDPIYWDVFPNVYAPDDTEGNSGAYQMVLALKRLQREAGLSLEGIRALDMGVGSGPLSGYLLAEGARETIGADLSEEAVSNARYNLRRHLPGRMDRFRGYVGDLWDALPASAPWPIDLVVFNPPPFLGNPGSAAEAQIQGGADFSVIKRFVRGLPGRLSPKGIVLLRIHRFDTLKMEAAVERFGPKMLQDMVASEKIPLDVQFVEERGEFVVAVLTHQPVASGGLEERERELVRMTAQEMPKEGSGIVVLDAALLRDPAWLEAARALASRTQGLFYNRVVIWGEPADEEVKNHLRWARPIPSDLASHLKQMREVNSRLEKVFFLGSEVEAQTVGRAIPLGFTYVPMIPSEFAFLVGFGIPQDRASEIAAGLEEESVLGSQL